MRTSIQACGAATTTLARAEAERAQQHEALIGVGDLLAHEILAGDAEMRRAGGELADDLGGREKRDLDARQIGDRAAIVARAASLHEFEPGAGEERGRVLLQPPLRGNREDERRVAVRRSFAAPPRAASGRPRSPRRPPAVSLAAPSRRARPS